MANERREILGISLAIGVPTGLESNCDLVPRYFDPSRISGKNEGESTRCALEIFVVKWVSLEVLENTALIMVSAAMIR